MAKEDSKVAPDVSELLFSLASLDRLTLLQEKLGATPSDELWLEIDSYSTEAHLKKVLEAIGKDGEAPLLWEELHNLVGPGRSIAMGEFEGVAV